MTQARSSGAQVLSRPSVSTSYTSTLCIHPPTLFLSHVEKPCVTEENVKIYMQPKNKELTEHSYKYSDGRGNVPAILLPAA